MTYLDELLAKADAMREQGLPLPVDLLTELAAHGIDLSAFN